jgi:hypothetical protein
MSFKTDNKRMQTMLERVGAAADLIDDKRFLPFYRSVQIKLEKRGNADEWGRMIELAKSKDNASKYFAKLCKMVRDNTYRYVEKAKEVAGHVALAISDKIVKFGFGKFQKFYVRKCDEYINENGMAAFIELLEYVERKRLSQKYFAKAILNGKAPRDHYTLNIMGAK